MKALEDENGKVEKLLTESMFDNDALKERLAESEALLRNPRDVQQMRERRAANEFNGV